MSFSPVSLNGVVVSAGGGESQKVRENGGRRYKYSCLSVDYSIEKTLAAGTKSFGSAKPVDAKHLNPKEISREKKAFPSSSLVRFLTGDVLPEWIQGLGRMKQGKHGRLTPAQGYTDTFVTCLDEIKRMGGDFDPKGSNNPMDLAEKLDLKSDDVDKIKGHGAWMILIHPGSLIAIPTKRKSEWNPEYVEGGYTKSGMQEWVTKNVPIEKEACAGNVQIFKMQPNGETEEWKFFKGKLMPISEREAVIDAYVKSVRGRNIKASLK